MKAARSRELFTLIFERDGRRCRYCGIDVRPRRRGLHRAADLATLDHVHPRAFGGRTEARNLVLACQACNNRRGTMSVEEFEALRTRR
jgi:5-methylcytosine-specific restriction endonuclease McrA